MTSIVDPSLYLSNAGQLQQSKGSNLGKDDFLKLLVAQLEHQNPLEPMKDKAFISQMATFSSLEQMTNMNKKLEQFLTASTGSQWLDYTALIGKEVSWNKVTETESGEVTSEKMEGMIQSVHFKNGTVKLEMEDGTLINQEQVISFGLPSSSQE